VDDSKEIAMPAARNVGADDRLMAPLDVSEVLGVPTATLANWRSASQGPPFLRVGRHVRYRRPDLEEWIEERVQRADPVSAPR
jgi:predicted DNA-binding transcriptional regulator AlpA